MKKISVFIVTLVMCCVFGTQFTCYAQDYENTFPEYVPFSGGCYVEVNTSIGQGTFVFPYQYKDNTFGFSGNAYHICNITNSTVTGRFITSGGKEYIARFQSFGTAEIRTDSGYNNSYDYLTVNSILNTNINFTDHSELDRGTDISFKNEKLSAYQQNFLLIGALIVLLLFFILLKEVLL